MPEDAEFIEFMRFLFQIDPNHRPSAEEALAHKFFKWNIAPRTNEDTEEKIQGKSTSASAPRSHFSPK